jgi:D-beta-D-heptose 7-phosphate kinase/D-beta-D-heptose 1-phosphate adenosyltransferase
LGNVTVGLNSDFSVKKLKGEARPLFSQEDRKFMLESCKYVDNVVVFDEETPLNLIDSLKPDIIVKGGDYRIQEVAGHDMCEVKIFEYIDGYSTTSALERLNED